MTYDEHECTVIVKVTDAGNGKPDLTVTYSDDERAVFKNNYTPETEAETEAETELGKKTPPTTPKTPSDNPRTGDNNNIAGFLAIMGVSFSAIWISPLARRKRNAER